MAPMEDLISLVASLFFGYIRNIARYFAGSFSGKIQICLFSDKEE